MDLAVSWSICDSVVSTSHVPIVLKMPGAVNGSLLILEGRLSPPDDDARLAPLALPSSSALRC